MKLIRTKVRNTIGDADIQRIARFMINVYHGRLLFQEDGTAVAGATLENTPETYLTWEHHGITEFTRPVRGHIYLNFKDGSFDASFKSADFRTRLLAAFTTLNRWGWRQEVWLDHAAGSNQFTMERLDAADYHGGTDMVIVCGNSFYTKHREHKFQWIVSAEPPVFQYTVEGKHPKAHNLVASVATIVVDVTHTALNLADNYRVTGWPALELRIAVAPRLIHLSRAVGVDAHIYSLMGGASPEGKMWSVHMPYTRPLVAPEKGTAKTFLVKELKMLTHIAGLRALKAACDDRAAKKYVTDWKIRDQVEPDGDGTLCTVCRIPVFDQYYQVAAGADRTVVCKFCAHYHSATNGELHRGTYQVAVATSATTASSLIEALDMTATERAVLRHLYRETARGTIEFQTPKMGDELEMICQSDDSGGIVSRVAGETLVGIPTGRGYQTMLEQVHLFPEGSIIFEYQACF